MRGGTVGVSSVFSSTVVQVLKRCLGLVEVNAEAYILVNLWFLLLSKVCQCGCAV